MELTLTTPALLFPTISLLLLAYTNRFLAIANVIRGLHSRYETQPSDILLGQIEGLRLRVGLIRNMQALGISSLFLCVLCMMIIYVGWQQGAKLIFGCSLLLLLVSLGLSFREIQLSTNALNLLLRDLKRR
ncbi:MAG TPA: DUF2721 domain-containing protein [Gammaproteobacteria bacterium]|nr:DUF2721 domain-containing protein [Gammaproteobacteria bacterium]